MTFYYNISCKGNRGRYEIRRETTICKVKCNKTITALCLVSYAVLWDT